MRGRLAAIGTMRCDHLNAVVSQLLIQRIAVIGAIADQIFRFGFDHGAQRSLLREGEGQGEGTGLAGSLVVHGGLDLVIAGGNG